VQFLINYLHLFLLLADGNRRDRKAIVNAHRMLDEHGNLKDRSQQESIQQLGDKLAIITARLNV
jgi:hypothetical protein